MIAPVQSIGKPRFKDKSVLVTGGAGGMGLAAARMFSAEGGRVSVLDIQADAGNALVEEIEGRVDQRRVGGMVLDRVAV